MTKVVITIRKPKFAKIRQAASAIKEKFPVKIIIENVDVPAETVEEFEARRNGA